MEESTTDNKEQSKWIGVAQILTTYLVAAWSFLQFVDWALIRYELSPYWVDILLWFFVGIIPSLVIYLSDRERINNRELRLKEKIIFPVNFILLVLILFFNFRSTDLGATTSTYSFPNETGIMESQTMVKPEFRMGVPIFHFAATEPDSATQWLGRGITRLLYFDLLQDKNVEPHTFAATETTTKVEISSIFDQVYIDGEYAATDNGYSITTNVRKSTNGKLLSQKTFTGEDLLSMLDEISLYIRDEIGVREEWREQYIDLPLEEFTSPSIQALQYFFDGDYEAAVKEDSTFALAYHQNARRRINFSHGKHEERYLIDKAYQLRAQLPEQLQLETLVYRFIADNNWELAEKYAKLQFEMDPDNVDYSSMLYLIYSNTRQVEAFAELAFTQFEKSPGTFHGNAMIDAHLLLGEYDDLLDRLDVLNERLSAPVFTFKVLPLLLQGKLEEAQEILERTIILYPEYFQKPYYDEIIDYLSDNKVSQQQRAAFTGTYRNNASEWTVTYEVIDDRIIQYVNNQTMITNIVGGNHTLNTLSSRGFITKSTFLQDDNGSYYAARNEETGDQGTNTYWTWKIDKNITEAEALLESGKFTEAKPLYEKALASYPTHYFLNDALQHIAYRESKSEEELQAQYAEVAGSYGPRKFWVEDGRLWYKRDNLVRIELQPISANRYINLSNYRVQFEFEFNDTGDITASFSWQHDPETNSWSRMDDEINYYRKD